MMYPRYPNTILFVGEARDARDYAVRYNLGCGARRILNRPFVRVVNEARDLYGYSREGAAICYIDSWSRWKYETEQGRRTLREIGEVAHAKGFLTVEEWYYGIGFD